MAFEGFYPFVDLYVGYPYYETGTLTLTNGDATITGSGTTWTSAMAGKDIFFSSNDVPNGRVCNFIKTFTDATHMELTSPWTGASVSGVNYFVDLPSKSSGNYNWRIRVYPTLRQASGKNNSISTVIPLDVDESTDLGVATASAMPMQNATRVRHVDGWVFPDSTNKPNSSTVDDLIEDIEALSNYSGILGFRMHNTNWKGDGATPNVDGVILKTYTLKEQKILRGVSNWKGLLQMDVEPAKEF